MLLTMISSLRPLRIALGRWDPYLRVPSLELRDGKIKFLPGKGALNQFQTVEADFPSGSRIEYRVQKGDMFFEDDHAQSLERTLSAVEPNGSRKALASGLILYVGLGVAARNLQKIGIPFRAVSFYIGKDGHEVEREIPISRSTVRIARGLLLGSSNLLLGVIAGLFIRRTAALIVVGAIPFLVLAIAAFRDGTDRRAALVKMLTAVPIYATGYAVTVVLIRLVLYR